ncbi:MAG: CDP-diacylglycerol--serine O-phosphatidyltransferase [Candidatus Omnitrophica bacterium]|nr:CDP-diacylglycerol--serine O-phosphatidyltransferase [Candidatus Omnitrophota bacterium]
MRRFAWLPNLVTLFNLFTGFLAILMITNGRLKTAAWLILLALVWDSLDGHVARTLKNVSLIGRDLDSLADIVSFVAAPSLLALKSWPHVTPVMILPVFFFLGSGAYRLARFNALPGSRKYFRGLPSPAAAVIVALTFLACQKNGWFGGSPLAIVLLPLMVLLGFLMISDVAYPKLSALPFASWRSFYIVEAAVFISLFLAANPETALAAVALLFMVLTPAYPLPSAESEERKVDRAFNRKIS